LVYLCYTVILFTRLRRISLDVCITMNPDLKKDTLKRISIGFLFFFYVICSVCRIQTVDWYVIKITKYALETVKNNAE